MMDPYMIKTYNPPGEVNALLKSMDKVTSEAVPARGKYEQLGQEVGSLVDEKNKAYGDSFNKCDKFLKILYPNGVTPEQYTDVLCLVRIFDKLMRIATNKNAFGESPYKDIVGYALLGLDQKHFSH